MTNKAPQKHETIAVTEEQVRDLLAEGPLVRAELERRIAKMREVRFEERFPRTK